MVHKKYIQGKGKRKDRYYIYIIVNSDSKRTRKSTGEFVSKDYNQPLKDKNGNPILRRNKLVYPKVTPQDFESYTIGEAYFQEARKRWNKNKHGNIIKDVFNRNSDFLEYFLYKITTKKGQNGYKATLAQLKEYSKGRLSYSQIDLKFLNGFKNHLFTKKTISNNSVRHYLSLFRVILNEARAEQETDINPFEHFTYPKQQTKEKERLTIEEIKLISSYECNTIRQKYSLDAFVFSCFTGGLRYSDLSTLKWSEIKETYFITRQQKTGDEVKVYLHPVSKKILDKYRNVGHKKVFELMLTQTTNLNFLKKVAKECNINKKVNSHTARHTYASFTAQYGNDIHTTSKLLGHSDTKTTQTYLHTTDERKMKVVNSIPTIYD